MGIRETRFRSINNINSVLASNTVEIDRYLRLLRAHLCSMVRVVDYIDSSQSASILKQESVATTKAKIQHFKGQRNNIGALSPCLLSTPCIVFPGFNLLFDKLEQLFIRIGDSATTLHDRSDANYCVHVKSSHPPPLRLLSLNLIPESLDEDTWSTI